MELSVWLLVAIVSIFMYLIFIKNNEYLKIINNYAARINGLENEISEHYNQTILLKKKFIYNNRQCF